MKVLFSSLIWWIIGAQALAASTPLGTLKDYFHAAQAEDLQAYYAVQDTRIYGAQELAQRKALTRALWDRFDTLQYRLSDVRAAQLEDTALIRFKLDSRIRGMYADNVAGEITRTERLAAVLTRSGTEWKVCLVTSEKGLGVSLRALFLLRQVEGVPLEPPLVKSQPKVQLADKTGTATRPQPAGHPSRAVNTGATGAGQPGGLETGSVADYRLALQWPAAGKDQKRFKIPTGVAVDSQGFVYVVDRTRRIQKISPSGEFVGSYTSTKDSEGQFSSAMDIFCGPRDVLYVFDSARKGIVRFDADLKFIGRWDRIIESPYGLAVSQNAEVAVVEFYQRRVRIFDAGGHVVRQFGTRGKGPGQFLGPFDVAVDGQGSLFVLDRDGKCVQKFDKHGKFITRFGKSGTDPGQFRRPWSIAVGPAGNVYVTDHNKNAVLKFTNDGRFLMQWGNRRQRGETMRTPAGIAVDRQGNVFVAEQGRKVVSKYVPVMAIATK